ncbi:Protein phosphatase Slingshot 3 [Homalodisca vitripennis]|nr:Protein phosphatase Slingshot 3 [Homalodisca vitripennis]
MPFPHPEVKNLLTDSHPVEIYSLSECYFAGKGAALVLPPNERLVSWPGARQPSPAGGTDIQQHLQSMFYLLRPEETLKMVSFSYVNSLVLFLLNSFSLQPSILKQTKSPKYHPAAEVHKMAKWGGGASSDVTPGARGGGTVPLLAPYKLLAESAQQQIFHFYLPAFFDLYRHTAGNRNLVEDLYLHRKRCCILWKNNKFNGRFWCERSFRSLLL